MGRILDLFINKYNYTDFHELNLDWIISDLRTLAETLENFISLNTIKYADPIQWNITTQYEANTVVIDPVTGVAYLSSKPVPSGVALSDTNYWTVIFDLGSFVTKAAKNFTDNYESETTTTATFNTSAGDWLIWGDTLYKTLVNITAGDTYVIGSNITPFTMENVIGHLDNLTTTDKTSLVNAINEIVNVIGDLNNLGTVDKSSIVNAINNVLNIIGSLTALTTSDTSSIVNAINEVNTNTVNNSTAINQMNDLIYDLRLEENHKFILISDSYGEAPSNSDNWETKFFNYSGATGLRFAYSGCGFYTNQQNSILSNFSSETIADKESYTDIIACLGANDLCTMSLSELGNLVSAIGDFISYCRTNFPNAKIHIGFVGNTLVGSTYAGVASWLSYAYILGAYKDAAINNGAIYLNGVENVMRDFSYIGADYLHPTTTGADALAKSILASYNNSLDILHSGPEYLRVTPEANITINGSSAEITLGELTSINDNVIYNGSESVNIAFTTALSIGGSFVKIGEITTARSIVGNGRALKLPVTVQALSDISAGAYVNVPMVLKIDSLGIYLKSLYINSGVFETHSFTSIFIDLPQFTLPLIAN